MRLTAVLLKLGGAALAAVAMTLSVEAAEITGAGSTFVYPILSKWAADYSTKAGININYQSIGSGGGLAQINHPNFFWQLTADDIASVKGVRLLEIMNMHPIVNSLGAGPAAPSVEDAASSDSPPIQARVAATRAAMIASTTSRMGGKVQRQ